MFCCSLLSYIGAVLGDLPMVLIALFGPANRDHPGTRRRLWKRDRYGSPHPWLVFLFGSLRFTPVFRCH